VVNFSTSKFLNVNRSSILYSAARHTPRPPQYRRIATQLPPASDFTPQRSITHQGQQVLMRVAGTQSGYELYAAAANIQSSPRPSPTTRWSASLSSKVNSPHAINLRAFRGANLVTLPSKFGGNEPLVLYRVASTPGSTAASEACREAQGNTTRYVTPSTQRYETPIRFRAWSSGLRV